MLFFSTILNDTLGRTSVTRPIFMSNGM